MFDIVARLDLDATRCELQFSKGVASNIEEGIAEIKRLRAALKAVEDWWLSDGMKHFQGAPYAIFAVRAALNQQLITETK